jgi:hypothetical protein
MCPELLLSLIATQEVEWKQPSPRDEARRLVEVEESGTAAESVVRRLIHLDVGGAAVDL